MARYLVVGSPGLDIKSIQEHLDRIISDGSEVVTVCNKFGSGSDHVLDWQVADYARVRGLECTVSFSNVGRAVEYVKGHTLIACYAGPSQRCRDAMKLAKSKKRWYSRKWKVWFDDSIRTVLINVGS